MQKTLLRTIKIKNKMDSQNPRTNGKAKLYRQNHTRDIKMTNKCIKEIGRASCRERV